MRYSSFVLLALAACSSGGPTMQSPPPPPASVASVTVVPDTGTLVVGASLQLTATVRDTAGNALTGRTITWASDNQTVASISASGMATAVATGGPVHLSATSGTKSGVATISVIPPAAGPIGPQGGTVATPSGGATVTLSPGAVNTPVAVQVRDTQQTDQLYTALSTQGVELKVPLTGGAAAFQPNGSVQVTILMSTALPTGATAYVRARFKGVDGTYWAQATSVGIGRLTLSIPSGGFSDFKNILGMDTLDVILDAEGFNPAPPGSLRASRRGSFTLFNSISNAAESCPSVAQIANADTTVYADCSAGTLQQLRFQGTGPNTAVGIVLVHGWLPDVTGWWTYYRAQGIGCDIFGFSCRVIPPSQYNQSGGTPTPKLPGQVYFNTLIQALPSSPGSFGGAPLYVYNYQSYRDVSESAKDLYLLLKNEKTRLGLSGFVLVGHSMGGLVSRTAAQDLEAQGDAQTILGIITLGTPHLGTPLVNALTPNSTFRRLASVFDPWIKTLGVTSLAPPGLPRTEHTPLYMYGGDIRQSVGGRALFGGLLLPSLSSWLCKFDASCDNDGVVPTWSSVPGAFGATGYWAGTRPIYNGYDHSQLINGLPGVYFGSDSLYVSVASDLADLLQRAGADSLAFNQQPAAASAGMTLSPAVTVWVQDGLHRPIATLQHSYTVSITLGNNLTGATLSGTTAVMTAGGTATFADLSIDRPGTGYTLVATYSGTLTKLQVVSIPFNVSTPQVATIKLMPNPLSFSGVAAGSLPPAQTVAVTNSGTGSLGTLAVLSPNYQRGETQVQWLGAPSINVNTGIVTIQPNTTSLPFGTYHATVPVTASGNVSNSSAGINVTYTIRTAALLSAPTLTAPVNTLVGAPTTPTFRWTAVPGADHYWLMIAASPAAFPTDPTATSCPNCLMAGFTTATTHTLPTPFPNGVAAGDRDAGTLNAGNAYYWQVQGFAKGPPLVLGQYSAASSFTTAGPVAAPSIQLDRTLVPFNFTVGGTLPPLQTVTVSNGGSGTLNGLSISSVSYTPGQLTGWLNPVLTAPTAPTALSFVVTRSDLPQGVYTATIQLSSTAPGLTGGARTVTVTLTVSPQATAPSIHLARTTVPFTYTIGSPLLPAVQVDSVTNGGTGTLTGLSLGAVTYTPGQQTGWIGLPIIGPAAPTVVSIGVFTSLPAGTYSATVQVLSSAPGLTGGPQTITVTLTVSADPFAPPSNLQSIVSGSNSVRLQWSDNSSVEDGFQVEVATSQSGPFTVAAVPSANTTTYAFYTLDPASTYYYRVAATQGASRSTYSNTATVRTLSAFPTNLDRIAAASVGGLLYTFGGGNDANGYSGASFVYDPGSDQWSALPPVPSDLGGQAGFVSGAAVINGLVYATGGVVNGAGAGGAAGVASQLNVFDPSSRTWSVGTPHPIPTAGGVSVAINGLLYVYTQLPTNTLYRYSPSTQIWTLAASSPPSCASQRTGAAAGGRLYLFGGHDPTTGALCSSTDVFDPSTGLWTTAAAAPTLRSSATAATYGGKLLVVGGFECPAGSGCSNSSTVELFDPVAGTWTTLAPLQFGRANPGVAIVGNRAFVIGGRYGNSGLFNDQLNVLEIIDLSGIAP